MAILFFLLLFAGGSYQSYPGMFDSLQLEVSSVLHDEHTQWMVFLCLVIYLNIFLFLGFVMESKPTMYCRISNPLAGATGYAVWSSRYARNFWLACTMFLNSAIYAIRYQPSSLAITLLAGVVVGKGLMLWADIESKNRQFRILDICVVLLIGLLLLASVWSTDGRIYAYQAHTRWTGPWKNPNIFGLLMGTGIVLVVGLAAHYARRLDQTFNYPVGVDHRLARQLSMYCFCTLLCCLAVILMGRALLNSYSRGAWMSTSCGLSYLFYQAALRKQKAEVEKVEALAARVESGEQGARTKRSISCRLLQLFEAFVFFRISLISRLQRNRFPFLVVFCSAAVLIFSYFRQTDWHPARRAASAVNPVDFSWRNRITAWDGGWQMIAEHPWFGTGWNQPELLYEYYYLHPKLIEGAAIEMNDYLMLGATLGIPALFCFGMYLWLSFTNKLEIGNWQSEIVEMNWLQKSCRAGAIVLLVGLWFDGGLFILATAATFWILLELGNVHHECTRINSND